MVYGKYVGRVGALAVALGIGTAFANPAWADTTDVSTNTSDSSSPTAGSTSGGEATSTAPQDVAESGQSGDDATVDTDDELEGTGTDAEDLDITSTVEVEEAAADKAVTEIPDEGPASTSEQAKAAPEEAAAPPSDGTQDAPAVAAEPVTADRDTTTHANRPVETFAGDGVSMHVTSSATVDESITPAVQTDLMAVATLNQQVPTPAPAPFVGQPKSPLGVALGAPVAIFNIAAKVVSMLLAPIFNPGPSNPAEPPLILAVLAFARREIQRTFFNASPTAVGDIGTTSEGAPTNIVALANDTDPNSNDVITVAQYTQARNGVVALNADGSFTYTPNAGFTGTDTFSYTISDEASPWHVHSLLHGGHATTAAVTIAVTPFNAAPVAGADAAAVSQGSDGTLIDVLANDRDSDGDNLIITEVSQPADGAATFSSTGVTYTPAAGFAGTDTFSYTVSDGTTTSIGTVTVTVVPVLPINRAPVATDDTFEMPGGAISATINILGNDNDADGDALTITEVSGAVNGIVSFSGGIVTYTPTAGFVGTEIVNYTVSDGGLTASAKLTITVLPNNRPPTIGDRAYEVSVDISTGIATGAINVSDPDGDRLTFTLSTPPNIASGKLSLTDHGEFIFTPSLQALLSAWSDVERAQTTQFIITVSDGENDVAVPLEVEIGPHLDALIATLARVNSNLSGIAVGADGTIYVTNSGANVVSIITDEGETVIPVGHTPQAVAIDDEGWLWVVNSGDDTVSVISPNRSTTRTLRVGDAPSAIAFASDGTAYVTNSGAGTVSVLNVSGAFATVAVGLTPTAIATGPDGRLYTANFGDGSISIIDPTTAETDTLVLDGMRPYGIAVDEDGAMAVTDPVGDRVLLLAAVPEESTSPLSGRSTSDGVVTTSSGLDRYIKTSISMKATPTAVTAGRGGVFYVANSGANTVTEIDTASTRSVTSQVGINPQALGLGPDGRLYVLNGGSDELTILDFQDSSTMSVPVGADSFDVSVGYAGEILLRDKITGQLTVISPTQSAPKYVSAVVPTESALGSVSGGLVAPTKSGEIYVALAGYLSTRIEHYDAEGKQLPGVGFDNFLGSPTVLRIGADGRVYVAGSKSVGVFVADFSDPQRPTIERVAIPDEILGAGFALVDFLGDTSDGFRYFAAVQKDGPDASYRIIRIHDSGGAISAPAYTDIPIGDGADFALGDDGIVYAVSQGANSLLIIDMTADEPTNSIILDRPASSVAVDEDGKIFLTSSSDRTLIVLRDNYGVEALVNLGIEADNITLTPDARIVLSNYSGQLLILDSDDYSTAIAEIPSRYGGIGAGPTGVYGLGITGSSSGGATLLALYRISTDGQAIPSNISPSTLAGLWEKVRTDVTGHGGIKTQTVEGQDGTKRLIVYLGGTSDDFIAGDQAAAENLIAIAGELKPDQTAIIDAALAADGDIMEIMVVGYSQGGIDAQNIASAAKYSDLVRTVITFGSPIVDYPSHGDAIIHIQDVADPIPLTATLPIVNPTGYFTKVAAFARLPWISTAYDGVSGIVTHDYPWYLTWMGSHANPDTYRILSEKVATDTSGNHADIIEAINRFKGTVLSQRGVEH